MVDGVITEFRPVAEADRLSRALIQTRTRLQKGDIEGALETADEAIGDMALERARSAFANLKGDAAGD